MTWTLKLTEAVIDVADHCFFKVLVSPLILKLNALQPILFEIRVLLLLSFFFKKVSACVCLGCVLVFVFEIECLRVCVLGVC